jgi:drug/metabolite transporter (DMT)-like permease
LLAHWWSGPAHEPLTARRGLGVMLGFVGVAVLIGPGTLTLRGAGLAGTLGKLAVLVAALSYGFGALLSRRFGGSAMLVAPLSSQLIALLLALPLLTFWPAPAHIPSLGALAAAAELGILGTAIAYLLYFWLIHHVGATRTSLVTYLLPCTALFWGVALRGEHVSWNALAGLALVLVGTMVTNGVFARLGTRLVPRGAAAPLSLEGAEAQGKQA